MSDYISRDELFDSIRNDAAPFNVAMVFRHIHNMPAVDAVPVVRCPQCVHYEDNGYHFCNEWEHCLPDDSEFFCAFGKRKEADT